MEYWIVRDERGFLFLYDDEPYVNGYGRWKTSGNYYLIDDYLFPEVTFENSPKRVQLKLIEE